MKSAEDLLTELEERGLIQQCSNQTALLSMLHSSQNPPIQQTESAAPLESQKLHFYLGIDPTASSLHCGHLIPILLSKRLAMVNCQPIILLGTGTAMIGDPSGKTETRKILTKEEIIQNTKSIQEQITNIFQDSPIQPIYLHNGSWIDQLNYIDFLREIGSHFSVNRMLSFESYKQRLEKGLSFIEFNYQLLQSFDYLKLFQDYHCLLQIGGDDQWGNMVSGIDLIRRYHFSQKDTEQKTHESQLQVSPQVLTVPLITTATGKKMGKTENGVIFLDSKNTNAFDFFQYWRNCNDADVEKFLLLFTFLPVHQIKDLCKEPGFALNYAKQTLAFELCQIVHGAKAAENTLQTVRAAFQGGESNHMPQSIIDIAILEKGVALLDLYIEAKLCKSRNEARRLIQGGGAKVNQVKKTNPEEMIDHLSLNSKGTLLLQAGKKRFFLFTLAHAPVNKKNHQ